jgi:fructose-1,6-bisphosphatase/inositol monophosphatase family enzyme
LPHERQVDKGLVIRKHVVEPTSGARTCDVQGGREVGQLREAALEAMRSGLTFAQRHLLEGEAAVDADTWYPDDLPADERDRLLLLLRTDSTFTPEDLEIHLGAEPIPADRRTHVLMSEILKRRFPSCYVVGEEATSAEWDAAMSASDGDLIFSLDAIDGSLPYDCLTFGYSTNLLAYERRDDHDELLLAAVANSSQLLAYYEAPGTVQVGNFETSLSLTQPFVDDFRTDAVALLASTPDHRSLAAKALEDMSFTVFTTGGAPPALGLVVGRLAALAAVKPQTTHDAAFLPILAFLGVPIITDDGTVLTLQDVLNFFSHVARRQSDRRAHPVPRFVAARDPIFGAELARRLFAA